MKRIEDLERKIKELEESKADKIDWWFWILCVGVPLVWYFGK